MPRYNLPVLGVTIAINTEADEQRVRDAKDLLETLFDRLNTDGKNVSKEKLLTVVALSLADDYLQSNQRLMELENKLNGLLEKIDGTGA